MSNKIKGLLLLLLIYIFASVSGVAIYFFIKPFMNPLLAILVADVVATILVWFIGLPLKTASVYDPYWSVQTIIIGVLLMIEYGSYNLGTILFLVCVGIWSIRLTVNFCFEFTDLKYIDWRYAKYREQFPRIYQLINLFGFCLMPTFIVYTASLPLFVYIIEGFEFNFLSLIGAFIMLIGVLLELVADIQMKKFRKERKDRNEIIRTGLWKYSRHPNYLGEIMFWYGVAFFGYFGHYDLWWLLIGCVANTLLFVFISIPLAENNMKKYKLGFDDYKRETRVLFLFPRFKKNK